jgi:hypothetical protein
MLHKQRFSSNILTQLNDIINSPIVANLKTPNDIRDVVYPYVRAVIDYASAYEESKTSYVYKYIGEHIESNMPHYKLMDLNTSMCFTLYMCVYH